MKDETHLNKLPLFISMFGTMILSLSVVYDYGFFTVLGTSFSEMPTTLSDQLRSSLTWIPSTVIAFFAVLIIELFNRRIEQGMSEEELIKSSPTPKFTAWFRKSPLYGIIAVAFMPPLALFFNIVLPFEAWSFTFIIFWFLFHNFLFGHENIIQQTSKEFYMITRWVPVILIFIAFNGAIAANKIKAGAGNTYVLELKKTIITATLVRTFDKHYLLWNKDLQAISLVNVDQIIKLYPVKQQKPSNKNEQTSTNPRVD